MKLLQLFIIGLAIIGWITKMQATTVTISHNSCKTVGANETKPYQSVENLEVVLGEGTECIGVGAFKNFKNLVSVTYNGENSVQIAAGAFYGCCNLTKLSIPVTGAIGRYSFYNCASLQRLDLPYTTFLSPKSFVNCENLQTVRVSENCTGISDAFENCPKIQVEKVSLHKSLQDLDLLP